MDFESILEDFTKSFTAQQSKPIEIWTGKKGMRLFNKAMKDFMAVDPLVTATIKAIMLQAKEQGFVKGAKVFTRKNIELIKDPEYFKPLNQIIAKGILPRSGKKQWVTLWQDGEWLARVKQ